MARGRRALLGALLASVVGMLVATPALAADATPTLDGRLDEVAWAGALALDVEPLDAGEEGGRGVAAEAKVLASDGHLWIGVAVAEPPGPGMGFDLLLGADGIERAAEAVLLGYGPQDPRGPLYVARGPRGVGRGVYRLEAAVDLRGGTRWSVEARLPLEDLDLPADASGLRLAIVVRSRRPGRVAWAPPEAAFAAPASWQRVEVPAEARRPAGEPAAPERLVAEDLRDAERREAWRLFLDANRRATQDMVQARGFENVLDPQLTREALRDAVARPLLEPLARMRELRPDLALVHVLRGDVLRRLGESEGALEAYAAAASIVPGLPEAAFGAWVQTLAPAFSAGTAGEATDYAAAQAELAAAKAPADDGIAADGLAYARALLDLAEGGDGLQAAATALDALTPRYGFDQLLAFSAERARAAVQAWGAERQRRRVEAERDDLPRVRLRTSRGDILLELFEDDVPNTVAQFVHLVREGVYDGAAVGTTIPFLAALVALDREPGHAVPTEARHATSTRPAFRGVVGLLGTERDTEAAAFFLTTGTATHLADAYVVFGRIVEGQAAADALRQGDVVEKASIVRLRPGSTYRPVTTQGEPVGGGR